MTGAPLIPHSQATRIAHAGLSLAVGVELLSGIIMRAPLQNVPANGFFEVHLVSDLAAAAFALAFWGVILTRKSGTGAGLLFPWFSIPRTRAFWRDLCAQIIRMRALHVAPYDEASPISAALHGLGLLLVTAMGASGLVSDLAEDDGFDSSLSVLVAADLHQVLADLVWVYLLAHGLMALIHHYGLDTGLGEMWSLGHSTDIEGREK